MDAVIIMDWRGAPPTPPSAHPVAAAELSAGPANMYSDTGVAKLRAADATDLTRPANCWLEAGVVEGAVADVLMPGQWIDVAVTPGATYWLAVGGGISTNEPPADAGHGAQLLGWGDELGERLFLIAYPIAPI